LENQFGSIDSIYISISIGTDSFRLIYGMKHHTTIGTWWVELGLWELWVRKMVSHEEGMRGKRQKHMI